MKVSVIMRYRGTHICIVPPLSRLLPFFILHILGARDLHSGRCGYRHRRTYRVRNLIKYLGIFLSNEFPNHLFQTNVLLRFLSSSLFLFLLHENSAL